MPETLIEPSVRTFQTTRVEIIDAPIEIVFESVLDEIGPEGQMPDGKAFPMKFEAWPGGRWYRDLGNNAGHFWGHVQVIKPPKLLELCGPMFMSYPAANFLQYRLAADGRQTRLTLTHQAMGLIPETHLDGIELGWNHAVVRIRELAARRVGRNNKESKR